MSTHTYTRKSFILFTLAATLMTSACVSTPPNPLTQNVREQYFYKDTTITWALSEKSQAKELKKDTDGKRSADKEDLLKKLKAALTKEFSYSPSGPTPMNFDIQITKYSRVSNVIGNVIGGSNFFTATVTVENAASGEELGVYEKVIGYRASNAGILGVAIQAATKPDITGILANSFAKDLRKRFDNNKTTKK